jgi:hypothetical protein
MRATLDGIAKVICRGLEGIGGPVAMVLVLWHWMRSNTVIGSRKVE